MLGLCLVLWPASAAAAEKAPSGARTILVKFEILSTAAREVS